jgi:hypothetical protein
MLNLSSFLSFQTYIDKGSDLLDEASMLTQSGTFGEATGIKDVAKTLKKHIQMFTAKLEETRERIEDTSKCYNLLDRVGINKLGQELVLLAL